MHFLIIFFTGWLHQIFLFQIYNLLLFSHPVMSNSAPMDCSTTGLPVHYLLELVQTHTHRASDVIQPSCPLSSPFSLAFNPSQHQFFPVSWLYTSVGQIIGASESVLPMIIQGLFPLLLSSLISLQFKWLSKIFFNTTIRNINSSLLSCLYGSTLTSIHDYWKNHCLDYMDLFLYSNVSAF